ncbi:hypothetical protein C8R43DRAFT_1134921 [Mycena crocata]|nr:hypothetical protein C8R43DRAFT_1134921 [Mycena crocata]
MDHRGNRSRLVASVSGPITESVTNRTTLLSPEYHHLLLLPFPIPFSGHKHETAAKRTPECYAPDRTPLDANSTLRTRHPSILDTPPSSVRSRLKKMEDEWIFPTNITPSSDVVPLRLDFYEY